MPSVNQACVEIWGGSVVSRVMAATGREAVDVAGVRDLMGYPATATTKMAALTGWNTALAVTERFWKEWHAVANEEVGE